jgi:SAM-dependent methyltransferase
VALAQRFPTARVHALDVSEELLAHVRDAAAEAEVADRVEARRVDLNEDWPAELPSDVDLVWAALSLHHLDDPATALRRAYSVLRPGGVLVLTELAGEPRFAPVDLGSGLTALHERIQAARAAHGHARTDWPELLVDAGFSPAEQHDHELIVDATTAEGAQYLEHRLRAHGDDALGDDDQAALEMTIASLQDGTSPISHRSGRTVWVAVRPQTDGALAPAGDIDAEVAVVGGSYAGLAAAIISPVPGEMWW